MSTRRARIKAVTSLPPRRKNAEASENKTKNTDSNSTTCISNSVTEPGIESNSVSQKPNHTSACDLNRIENSVVESQVPKTNSSSEIQSGNSSENQFPTRSTVIASTSSVIKNATPNTFLSPQKRDSPKKTFASPFARSPKPKLFDKITTPIVQQMNDSVELFIKDAVVDRINHSGNSQRKNDNANDETVFDGIIPLQPEGTVHKPIDLLKSEIISENAEVLFDPIVPLPSPSKVRPKLKPVPRLGPHRRNSIQGSASESEDESRRSLLTGGPPTPAPARQRYDSHTSHSTMISLPNRDVSRVRNDSICSNVSQTAAQPNIASPLKEKQVAKVRRPEVNRRMHASKRRKDFANRESLTMYDLIFYNPTSNPIVPDQDEVKAKEENEKDKAAQTKKEEIEKADSDEAPEDVAPVPQIKLGPNGEIILDEKSLVIKPTENNVVSGTVREGAWSGGGGRYKRAPRSADWTPAETVRFYRALAALGTDFTLMAPLFPSRTRNELKLKFKKEEKLNGAQVDKALRSATGWDMMGLREEFEEERQKAAQKEVREREQFLEQQRAERARRMALRRQQVRRSKGSNAVETSGGTGIIKSHPECTTADDLIERAKYNPKRNLTERAKKEVFKRTLSIHKTPDTLPKPSINVPKTPVTPNTQPDYAKLTLINRKTNTCVLTPNSVPNTVNVAPNTSTPQTAIPQVPSNIETGSLVVLTVNDPNNPGKKMLQTYIAHGPDKLTPIALPASFLNSVVGYMNKNSAKGSNGSSPVLSPSSIASQDSLSSAFSNTTKRQRNSSFTITQL